MRLAASTPAWKACGRVAEKQRLLSHGVQARKVLQITAPWKGKARDMFGAVAYSTAQRYHPDLGSNNDVDPRGVDFSLFEPVNTEYAVHTDDVLSASSSRKLSPSTTLLLRLINEGDIDTATTCLREFQTLGVPLTEAFPEFSLAALIAVQNGRMEDAAAWMLICPKLSNDGVLDTASDESHKSIVKNMEYNLRQMFVCLMDQHGTELDSLQRLCVIVANKGYTAVLQAPFAHILRYGKPDDGRQTWHLFFAMTQSDGLERSQKLFQKRRQAEKLFDIGLRSLALAGRLQDALHWVASGLNPNLSTGVLKPGIFTDKLLREEFAVRGTETQQQKLLDYLDPIVTDPKERRVKRDTFHHFFNANQPAGSDRPIQIERPSRDPNHTLDRELRAFLTEHDIVGARAHLLATLAKAERVWLQSNDGRVPQIPDQPVFAHLPSAAVLSEFQALAGKVVPIAVQQKLSSESGTAGTERTVWLTETEFLDPVKQALEATRAGKGLWEMAILFGFMRTRRYTEAVRFYVGPDGFRIPAGGITADLVNYVLRFTVKRDWRAAKGAAADDVASWGNGRLWPSTHAINVLLQAIASLCINSRDIGKLDGAYRWWKQASMPIKVDTQDATEPEPSTTPKLAAQVIDQVQQGLPTLSYSAWPGAHRPDSYTFNPFLHAFALRELYWKPSRSGGRQSWESGRAMFQVLKDMTDVFGVKPDIYSWTIVLDSLARDGAKRWEDTTENIARAVGINTLGLDSIGSEDNWVVAAAPNFPDATMPTYAALILSLLRADQRHMLPVAQHVRDDLLIRVRDLDMGDHDDAEFWQDTVNHWQRLRESTQAFQRADKRPAVTVDMLLSTNHQVMHALHELWCMEEADD